MTSPTVQTAESDPVPETPDVQASSPEDVPVRLSSTRGMLIIGITAATRLIDDM